MDPNKTPKMALIAVQDAGKNGIISSLNAVISTSPGKLIILSGCFIRIGMSYLQISPPQHKLRLSL
jgi:hypothetical protein